MAPDRDLKTEMSDLQNDVCQIDDPETILLINELATLYGFDLNHWKSMPLFHFLQQIVYPNGTDEFIPLDKKDLDAHDPVDAFVLRKKIKDLGNPLHSTCAAMPFAINEGIDNCHGMSLYLFLNKALKVKKRKKSKFKRIYW